MGIAKTLGVTVLVGAAAALVGCAKAPIPLAENFDLTVQPKVRSAGHWELVSRDVVAQTMGTLERSGFSRDVPLYVGMPVSPSPFDQAFRDFLITQLVQSGAKVVQTPGQALEVSYNAQLVRHNSDRPHFIPGQFTMLTAGVMAIYGLHASHIDTQLLGALGVAGAADYASSINSGGPTNTEMILTTTVSQGGQYLVRKTDVYYLENVDAPLFMRPPAQPLPVNMKVVSQ